MARPEYPSDTPEHPSFGHNLVTSFWNAGKGLRPRDPRLGNLGGGIDRQGKSTFYKGACQSIPLSFIKHRKSVHASYVTNTAHLYKVEYSRRTLFSNIEEDCPTFRL